KAPVNYWEGTIHYRTEVLSRPSDKPIGHQICLWSVDVPGVEHPHACAEPHNVVTKPGVYENHEAVPKMFCHKCIDWEKITRAHLVVWDVPPDGNKWIEAKQGFDLSQYYPMKVRFTAVLVSKGAKFEGWPKTPAV